MGRRLLYQNFIRFHPHIGIQPFLSVNSFTGRLRAVAYSISQGLVA